PRASASTPEMAMISGRFERFVGSGYEIWLSLAAPDSVVGFGGSAVIVGSEPIDDAECGVRCAGVMWCGVLWCGVTWCGVRCAGGAAAGCCTENRPIGSVALGVTQPCIAAMLTRCWASSTAVWTRASGFFWRSCMTSAPNCGVTCACIVSGCGSTNRWEPISSPAPSFTNGGLPETISQRMQPNDYTSA